MKRSQLIADVTAKVDDSCWTVHPVPGFVVKFKDPRYLNSAQQLGIKIKQETISAKKLFLNIAHCTELPAPKKDLDEDEVTKLMGTEDCFKIPISLNEVDQAVDNQGEIVLKIDVLVNSAFFHKKVQTSEFFRQLLIITVIQAVEARHQILLDSTKQVILRNKKVIGELNPQRVKKKPNETFDKAASQSYVEGVKNRHDKFMIEEIESETNESTSLNLFDESSLEDKKPRNYRVQILRGQEADIRIKIRDVSGELVHHARRITLKMNDDRCAVLLDGTRAIADFFLPFYLLDDEAKCEFDAAAATLIIRCPINWR